MKTFWDDLRFAARQLWRHPLFTTTAVLTLALGIGTNAAIFTVVQAVLLQALPYNNADRLEMLQTHWDDGGRTTSRVTGPDAVDVREQSRSLEAISLYSGGSLGVQVNNHAAYTMVTMADSNFARVFALQPLVGHLFSDADAKHAAVVSELFARENFGSSQAAVGHVLRIEGEPVLISGVLSQSFGYPAGTQIWLAAPLKPDSKSRTAFNYKAVGLLRAGTSFAAAQTELEIISQRLQSTYAKDNRSKTIQLEPLQMALTGNARPTLLFLWAASGLILLIACLNVTHLELVRYMERGRELAIRRALGSSRWRVVQPVALESLLLALTGGLAGVLLAYPTLKVLVAMAPGELPRTTEIEMNAGVLSFALVLAMVAALLSAVVPALRAATVDPGEALKGDASRGMTRPGARRLRNGLVVTEIAAAFVLTVGASLLLHTMATLRTRDMGFNTRQLLMVDADAPAMSEAESSRAVDMFNGLFASLRELPGVERVAGVMGLPTGIYGSNGYYETRGGLSVDPNRPASSNFTVASPGYFAAMGIPLQEGRDFGPGDRHDSMMVAVISESLARQSFGKADPLGKGIRCGLDSDKWMTVVGVVGDVRQDSPAEIPGATLYMPMTQHPFYANQIHIVLRTATKPLSLMSVVDHRIAQADPAIARRYTTMDASVGESVATEQFRATLISAFAGVGLLLAMLGVYGTVAYSVAQRRFEFGLKMAFGADRGTILRLVLQTAAKLASLGIVAGVGLSTVLAQFVRGMLVGAQAVDPLTQASMAALLLATALIAALTPGWKATRLNPTQVLRGD